MLKKLFDNTKALPSKIKAGVAAGIATLGIAPTFCGSIDDAANNVLNAVFTLLKFGGIILIAVGIVQLVKAIMEASQGQSQPGAVGKALGMIVGGLFMAVIESVLSVFGIDTSVSFGM